MPMEVEGTSFSMLSGVGRNDPDAWQRFYDRYKLMVYARGRRYGMEASDVNELLSRVMAKCFMREEGRVNPLLSYDRSKGRFRDYFCRIVSNEAVTMLRERQRRREVPAENQDGQEIEFADTREEEVSQKEYRLCLLREAFEIVKKELPPRQLQAFMAVCMDGVSAKKVSRLQNVSLATVYNDVAAVVKSIRQKMSILEGE